jgi:hypothetical protein
MSRGKCKPHLIMNELVHPGISLLLTRCLLLAIGNHAPLYDCIFPLLHHPSSDRGRFPRFFPRFLPSHQKSSVSLFFLSSLAQFTRRSLAHTGNCAVYSCELKNVVELSLTLILSAGMRATY